VEIQGEPIIPVDDARWVFIFAARCRERGVSMALCLRLARRSARRDRRLCTNARNADPQRRSTGYLDGLWPPKIGV
jgi:hypothetical protein